MHGRVALVTGAASGIGAAVSRQLSALGATVYDADIGFAGPAIDQRRVALDVTLETGWTHLIHTILRAEHRLDILVNSAGISAASPITDTSLEEWRRVLGVNLDGAFLATKHGLRAMRSTGGAIIHVGSASGIRAAAGAAAYSTSKAALRMLVSAAAKECRSLGIPVRINVVSPAGVKTALWRSMPFFQELVAKEGSEEAAYAALTTQGGGPFLEPDQVARAICWLASDEAAHITGVELPVDDGYVL